MKIKIKNEPRLKKGIQEKLNELNSYQRELNQVKNEMKKCRQAIDDSEKELSALGHGGRFVSIENVNDAMKSADDISARKNTLKNIVDVSRKRIEALGILESNLAMKIAGLKEPVRMLREAYCTAYEDALKKTPEWETVKESIDVLKALWIETFSGNIYAEDIIGDLGFYEQPKDYLKEKARAELLIN